MKKILITGGSGMLGSYVASRAVESGWETWATWTEHSVEIPGCHMLRIDVRDSASVHSVVQEIMPDAVVHTAALVKPDICEERKADAFDINVLGTRNMVSAAESVNAHLVHVSTDMVFDGEQSPIDPDSPVRPVNYYGLTKASAEAAVRASRMDPAVVRTTIIYGPRMFHWNDSFSDKVIETLSAGRILNAFADQYRPPIPAVNLADVLLEIAERRLGGVYHAVCPEVSTRLQFARKIAQVFGLDADLIKPIYMDEVASLARRPKTLVLDTASTARILRTRLLGFEEGILQLQNRST